MKTCYRCYKEITGTEDEKLSDYCKDCYQILNADLKDMVDLNNEVPDIDDDSVPVPDLYTYMRQASRTLNPATKLKLSEQQVRLLNLSLGLSEVGELQNLIKKMIFHGHEVNVEKLMDEIGDIQWYLFMIMRELGIDPYAVLRQNITKLRERYPNGFSHEDSIKRKDVKK